MSRGRPPSPTGYSRSKAHRIHDTHGTATSGRRQCADLQHPSDFEIGRSVRLICAAESLDREAFDGHAGNLGDEVEVLVHVEDGELGQFRGCGDQQVRD